MRPTLTRSTQAMACAAALLTLAACGGDADGEKTSASSSSTSSEPTYDDDYAYAEAKKIAPMMRKIAAGKPLPKDTEWATASYIKAYNDQVASLKKKGITEKGSVTIDSMHQDASNPDAPGGWDMTMYECSTSTVRYYKDGKDVTGTPGDSNTRLPKGPHENVHLLSFTTSDDGKTWQLDEVQQLLGNDARQSPCAK
ncbi:hypothetical protein [Janibacter indicus]|uniref:Lipoprotein n=1 Tax=Janibacter indicus TaxID=857417 RepID=A0A1W1ZXF8_9MICO|nr:hypothetical protein [Janibacter indicus]SMC53036.1 hypothetical protein SAMN06296429_104295 [Janibacter indicus]